MAVSNLKRKKVRKSDNENKFFLYVIFYHMFSGIAGLFNHD